MTLPRTQGLHRLPYELIVYIVGDLDIEDVFHWSLCSKHFQYIIREDRFCKPVVMVSYRPQFVKENDEIFPLADHRFRP